jgi:glycerol transport system ATP-binding protein
LGFRADAAEIGPNQAGLSFSGKVAVTELSGSESLIHVDAGHDIGTLICLVTGLHEWEPGDPANVQIDLAQGFIFGPDGNRITMSLLAKTA